MQNPQMFNSQQRPNHPFGNMYMPSSQPPVQQPLSQHPPQRWPPIDPTSAQSYRHLNAVPGVSEQQIVASQHPAHQYSNNTAISNMPQQSNNFPSVPTPQQVNINLKNF